MNPDQLWETTMNPDKRMLLQVKVEDAVETDEVVMMANKRPVGVGEVIVQNGMWPSLSPK